MIAPFKIVLNTHCFWPKLVFIIKSAIGSRGARLRFHNVGLRLISLLSVTVGVNHSRVIEHSDAHCWTQTMLLFAPGLCSHQHKAICSIQVILNDNYRFEFQAKNRVRLVSYLGGCILPGDCMPNEMSSLIDKAKFSSLEWGICGVGMTSCYRLKVEYTRQQWGRRCPTTAKRSCREQRMFEDFLCLNTIVSLYWQNLVGGFVSNLRVRRSILRIGTESR